MSVCRLVNVSVYRLVNESVYRLVNVSVCRLVNVSVCRLVNVSVCRCYCVIPALCNVYMFCVGALHPTLNLLLFILLIVVAHFTMHCSMLHAL